MILLLLACPPKLPDVVMVEPPVEAVEEPGAGRIAEGRFIDGRHDFSIAVPVGWEAEVWSDAGPLRVSIVHSQTGTRVEAWAFEQRLVEPAPRGNCAWNFIDRGIYREVLRPRMVASCTPNDPNEARISAYLLDRGTMTWQLELYIPIEHLSAGRQVGEVLLSSVQL